MARTNLAYLNEAVNGALDRQIADPHSVGEVAASARVRAKKRIAGIEVFDSGVVETKKDERRALLQRHRNDVAELKQKLDAAGVSYLTVWPTKAWEQVCKEHPLYTLDPDQDGRVRVSAEWLKDIESQAVQSMGTLPLVSLLLGGASSAAVVVATFGFGAIALCGAAGAACVGGYVSGEVAHALNFKSDKPDPKRLARTELGLMKKLLSQGGEKLWKMLLPEGREVSGGVRLAIDLPKAPEDAQENLVRAAKAGFPLTLHTVSEAIAFRGDPAEPFVKLREGRYAEIAKEIQRKRDEEALERARRRAMRSDPIVTTTHKSAIAIIVQYGDFPIEKTLVDKIVNSSALI